MIEVLKEIFFSLLILCGIMMALFLLLTFLVMIVKVWRERK